MKLMEIRMKLLDKLFFFMSLAKTLELGENMDETIEYIFFLNFVSLAKINKFIPIERK